MYDDRRASPVARFALAIGVASWLALAAAGPLHRLGALGLRPAFLMLAAACIGLVVTLLLSVSAIIGAARRRSGRSTAVTALFLALIAIGSIGALAFTLKGVPPIHDITTDTVRPPRFVAILPLRAAALNPVEYGGPSVAERQHASYPDVTPLTLNVAPGIAFDRALAAAKAMEWEMVESNPTAGRIEATATTLWFGFKDDVVIRVMGEGSGSRVDVRSLSRVGVGDAGTNARRIRKYLGVLRGAGL